MASRINATNQEGNSENINLRDLPDTCPLCHRTGTFSPFQSFVNTTIQRDKVSLEVIFRCPSKTCYEVFIGYYYQSIRPHDDYRFVDAFPKRHSARTFSDTINSISPNFQSIYNEAQKSESEGLTHVCGPGYRKALEFLIKDYLIGKSEGEEDQIRSEFLGTSIQTRIEDARLKTAAQNASWLGNDETHYTRKWEGKDLNDLKNLIDLTVHWIEAEDLTSKLLNGND